MTRDETKADAGHPCAKCRHLYHLMGLDVCGLATCHQYVDDELNPVCGSFEPKKEDKC